MNDRTRRLREQSLNEAPSISSERAELLTRFYREHDGEYPVPIMRARAFHYLCRHKTIYLGDDELIVGERGPAPKQTPTFPELTCHSREDLEILDSREKTSYQVPPEVIETYERDIIPFWRGRSQRDRIFAALPERWHDAYAAGVFTEFMEQRAPGHRGADGKIYRQGMRDFQARIAEQLAALPDADVSVMPEAASPPDPAGPPNPTNPSPTARRHQLEAMSIAADAVVLFAERHAELAEQQAAQAADSQRRAELEKIASACRRVPAQPPRDFHEALQMYWFCHLAVVTELNGWDAFSPGHLDQHLEPFYERELAAGSIDREDARELLECFFVKFNNHPAPPKVGVTAAESGTYTDFANINLAGLRQDGTSGESELSFLLLEVIDELHLLQPSNNIQISQETSDEFLLAALRVIAQGYGFPSVFNADMVVKELLRQGKTLADAREGGTSGCVEAGAFGKEAYILTGYFNLPKILELTLHNGRDPRTGQQLGPWTGDPCNFNDYNELFDAWRKQLAHFVEIKLEGNRIIEQLYAARMPAPLLSLITSDCIEKGLDYNAGGARYNTAYIQGVGIGTLTDCLASLEKHVFVEGTVDVAHLMRMLDRDFAGGQDGDGERDEIYRQLFLNRAPKWGNDDDAADNTMRAAFDVFFAAVDGRPNERGGRYHIDMLPTTCHVYFGSVCGALPDGRQAGTPLSEGISPVQGMDRDGPTAVLLSAAKMDHVRTGGTLLNLKFTPDLVADDDGRRKIAALIRTYFRLGGHHMQFNIVSAETLRQAQAAPQEHRDLIVRVAGYSDYFCDLSSALQNEIITRTEHGDA